MSLLSVLKTIGKDLGHVGNWIDDGLKVVQPIATAIDPSLAPIFTAIEGALDRIPQGAKVDAGVIQKIVTSATTIAALGPCCPCCKRDSTDPLLVGRDTPNGATQAKESKS